MRPDDGNITQEVTSRPARPFSCPRPERKPPANPEIPDAPVARTLWASDWPIPVWGVVCRFLDRRHPERCQEARLASRCSLLGNAEHRGVIGPVGGRRRAGDDPAIAANTRSDRHSPEGINRPRVARGSRTPAARVQGLAPPRAIGWWITAGEPPRGIAQLDVVYTVRQLVGGAGARSGWREVR